MPQPLRDQRRSEPLVAVGVEKLDAEISKSALVRPVAELAVGQRPDPLAFAGHAIFVALPYAVFLGDLPSQFFLRGFGTEISNVVLHVFFDEIDGDAGFFPIRKYVVHGQGSGNPFCILGRESNEGEVSAETYTAFVYPVCQSGY
ncbi:MAG: hypothetical protein QMC36_09080 [Patescibacteria group bacterium]